jgi:hypothetical protein
MVAAGSVYIQSLLDAVRLRKHFATVQRYCMFVGYPRSGHSLIGALLNVHPNITIAHEMDLLRYLQVGVSRAQLLAMLWRRNEAFLRGGSHWEGYNYSVPSQAHDGNEPVRVIGDKKGGTSALRVLAQPDLLDKLHTKLRLPIHVVHVVRNPYDNIATIAMRGRVPPVIAIEKYRRHCLGVEIVRSRMNPQMFVTVRYEDFIARPASVLEALCSFLGEDAPAPYVAACCARVFTSARRTRDSVQWTASDCRMVAGLAEEFTYLRGYSFA